jgi:hypothetical protein
MKLDPITQTLFESIMQKIKKKQTIPSSMRNSLLLDLYYNYSFDSHSLGDLFKLKVRTVKQIIKDQVKTSILQAESSKMRATGLISQKIFKNKIME